MAKKARQAHDARDRALSAVVRVGNGRGFIVESSGRFGRRDRNIITAGHCLPFVPPCFGFSSPAKRTYANLLARLGEQPSIWCECLFIDPVADIAVLGSPDNQDLSDQADNYEALVAAATSVPVAEPPSRPIAEEIARLAELRYGPSKRVRWARRECRAFLLSLNNHWFPCKVQHAPNNMLSIFDAADEIAGGMSGSPIIAEGGRAIGIVCTGSEIEGGASTLGGPNPRLMGNLPGWFLKTLVK
jgi:hypothetical protein